MMKSHSSIYTNINGQKAEHTEHNEEGQYKIFALLLFPIALLYPRVNLIEFNLVVNSDFICNLTMTKSYFVFGTFVLF